MPTKTGSYLFSRTSAAATLALVTLAIAPDARAQNIPVVTGSDAISARGKGMAGGGLLGAEVVTITGALIGVKSGWYYLIGGILGAGAGVAAGFVVEEKVDPEASMALLAGGITLAIPAIVLSLNATRYVPDTEASEDQAPTGPTPEPGQVGGSVVVGGSGAAGALPPQAAPTTGPAAPPVAPATPPGGGGAPPAPPPSSLLNMGGGGGVRMGVPVPQVRAVYSLQQLKESGVPQQTEYRLPVLNVRF